MNLELANEQQREAITTIEGPVLIIAGPGTGKTYTLVNRIIYMIKEKGVKPEEIMISTFTDKAAKELITRITNELDKEGIALNLHDMYIGTFHSICGRLISENLIHTSFRKNYRPIDGFEQRYIVFKNIKRFQNVDGYADIMGDGDKKKGAWAQSGVLLKYIPLLIEELVDIEEMKQDNQDRIRGLAQILEIYDALMKECNVVDFSNVQTETFKLLADNPEILKSFQEKIKYIMVDEYQDTNHIQESLVFLMGSEKNNICVVGDDDQGLYRFRGATIRNIIEFPNKFEEGACKQINLVTNYRSDKGIIDYYNTWMNSTNGINYDFDWKDNRYDKHIEAGCTSTTNQPTVIKCAGNNSEAHWHLEMINLIKGLKENNSFVNYNQIAFICNSVKDEKILRLIEALEGEGIDTYSPRSNMFFHRREIKEIIGCLIQMFPTYYKDIKDPNFFIPKDLRDYYLEECIPQANNIISADKGNLGNYIKGKWNSHGELKGNTDYLFMDLVYQLFAYEPFSTYLNVGLDEKQKDVRPSRNLSIFIKLVSAFQDIEKVTAISDKNIKNCTNSLLTWYMFFLFQGGIEEYEDMSEYAPSGCISFLTIHQSKGMEFPIVLVDSLNSNPWFRGDKLMEDVANGYFSKDNFEKVDDIKYYDFWRGYYTAFSRAQNLLVLTCNETTYGRKTPNDCFRCIYDPLPSYTEVDLKNYKLETVKPVNIKHSYSYTTHIAVYANCPKQYKFFKELEFTKGKNIATMFGSLVHITIEDIHEVAMKGEGEVITTENIEKWFHENYETLSLAQGQGLGQVQKDAALRQVLRYVDGHKDNWQAVKESEIDVSLVKENYILRGAVDMVRETEEGLEIVDFKSERKPSLEELGGRMDIYRKQLNVYAYLVEQQLGKKVEKLHIYYTGEPGDNPLLTFEKSEEAVEETMREFDIIVENIQKKNFHGEAENEATCARCEFKYYCKK